MSTAPPSSTNGTQSLRRLLDLLDQFTSERPSHSVEELRHAIGVPRSTVYRLVSLLTAHELLEQTPGNRYQLGPRAITMGYVARSTVDLADLWRPVLERLATETSETTLVLRRIGESAVCVDRVECGHLVRLSFEIGRAMPLHTGAGAKVLLAYSSDVARERYLAEAVPAPRRAGLRAELERIRQQGWGESTAEVDPGIWAVAAPILVDRDRRCLAISVALPEYRLQPDGREHLRHVTVQGAAELRSKLAQYA